MNTEAAIISEEIKWAMRTKALIARKVKKGILKPLQHIFLSDHELDRLTQEEDSTLTSIRLKLAREAKGLKKIEVAKQTGIKYARVDFLERGAKKPLTDWELNTLAELYGVTLAYLTGDDLPELNTGF